VREEFEKQQEKWLCLVSVRATTASRRAMALKNFAMSTAVG
jgi:hypothetical protein